MTHTEHRNKANRQKQCADPLKKRCSDQHPPYQPDHAAHLHGANGLCQQGTLPQTDASADGKRKQDGNCHKSKSPDLNQQQNDNLSKIGKLRPGVINHKAGDTGRGCGGKKRVQKRNSRTAAAGDWQA
ncbi:hypothetical protein SDC9_98871 [bioreactor metagenome]|uniref:Uncharacterized protein n=1 Tax=bioreactor metagenome TaxID=1076179 RepID=A0A645AFY3_9ZZZZ